MTVDELKERTNLAPLNAIYDKDIVGSLVTDIVREKMAEGQAGSIWVTDRTKKDIVDDAQRYKIATIIVTEGQPVGDDVLRAADNVQTTIFSTPHPLPAIVGELDALGIRITPYGDAAANKQ